MAGISGRHSQIDTIPIATRSDVVNALKKHGDTLSAYRAGDQLRLYEQIVDGQHRLHVVTSDDSQRHPSVRCVHEGDGLYLDADRFLVVPQVLCEELHGVVNDPKSDVACHSAVPVERAFVVFDVADYSKYPAGQQLMIVKSLIRLASFAADDLEKHQRPDGPDWSKEADLCLGDGYVYVFLSSPAAARFASVLCGLVEEHAAHDALPIEFHFRAGVHTGPVYRFFDPGRDGWNYSGSGINDASRILGVVPKDIDDVCYVSKKIYNDLMIHGDEAPIGNLYSSLVNRGRRKDKHGKMHRVYELQFARALRRDRAIKRRL